MCVPFPMHTVRDNCNCFARILSLVKCSKPFVQILIVFHMHAPSAETAEKLKIAFQVLVFMFRFFVYFGLVWLGLAWLSFIRLDFARLASVRP